MRLVVTGLKGQVAAALAERAAFDWPNVTVLLVGRPLLDLAQPGDVVGLFRSLSPDVVVNAAAYTAVDQAESEPDLAMAINASGAGAVAAAAYAVRASIIHLSSDYVFDGRQATPYIETDPVGPISSYGRSKLAGEKAVAAANPDHAILRTAWIYAAEGTNFLRSMLRLATNRPEISVVADQRGNPSYAPDIANIVFAIARNLRDNPGCTNLRGILHVAGGGETDWASFAEEIFRESAIRGGPFAAVRRITSDDYPTAAKRPANSRLDCTKLRIVHGGAMRDWRDALSSCMDRLMRH